MSSKEAGMNGELFYNICSLKMDVIEMEIDVLKGKMYVYITYTSVRKQYIVLLRSSMNAFSTVYHYGISVCLCVCV